MALTKAAPIIVKKYAAPKIAAIAKTNFILLMGQQEVLLKTTSLNHLKI